jgi:hypothetical protein
LIPSTSAAINLHVILFSNTRNPPGAGHIRRGNPHHLLSIAGYCTDHRFIETVSLYAMYWNVQDPMFERFFEKDAKGTLKGLTLEWACPHCNGINFRILQIHERGGGE